MSAETCTIPGCNRAQRARKMCMAHYERWRAGKPPAEVVKPIAGRAKGLPLEIERHLEKGGA